MSFRTDIRDMTGDVLDYFGDCVVYKKKSGGQKTIRAAIDDSASVVEDDYNGTAVRPVTAVLHSCDIPTPVEGDLINFENVDYFVVEPILPDGFGGIQVGLRRG